MTNKKESTAESLTFLSDMDENHWENLQIIEVAAFVLQQCLQLSELLVNVFFPFHLYKT